MSEEVDNAFLVIYTSFFLFFLGAVILGFTNPSICETSGNCITSKMFYLLIVAPTLFFMLMALVFLESYLKDTVGNHGFTRLKNKEVKDGNNI